MVATNLPVRTVVETGLLEAAKTSFDETNGMSFVNDGKNTWLEVQNAHATESVLLTFTTPGTVRGQAIADVTRTVVALTTRRYGPFPKDLYSDPVTVTSDSNGTVTVAAYQLV